MKTYSAKPTEVTRKWHVIDASEAPIGRLSTVAAQLLTGKGKPMYTSHIDCGDYVVITNADDLVVTGKKLEAKQYYAHSGHPGNLKTASLKEELAKNSTDVVKHAVAGMLPKNKLQKERLARLKVYAGADHAHEGQKPEKFSLKGSTN